MTITPPASHVSRRTVVRGAAWSVPVVTVAAVAPAFAASAATSSLAGSRAGKWGTGQNKHVSWDLTLTNGPVAIDTISILFTYAPSGTGPFTTFEIYSYLPAVDMSWTFPGIPGSGTATVTVSHTAGIAANTVTSIHTDFAGSDNSDGTVTAVATVTYVGSATQVALPALSVGWDPGGEHTHLP